LDAGLSQLVLALDTAAAAVRNLMTDAERRAGPENRPPSSRGAMPPELARNTATRLQAAAEIGDIGELHRIAQSLEAHAHDLAPIARQIDRMVDNFDMEGLSKLAGELLNTASRTPT
jgi:hypothetical protein